MERIIEKRVRTWKTNPRQYAAEQESFLAYRDRLAEGLPLRTMKLDQEAARELKGLGLLTSKPILYVANVSEQNYGLQSQPCAERIQQSLPGGGGALVIVCARFEWELQQLSIEEQAEFRQALGEGESGLQRLVQKSYELLHLIPFYTIAHNKLSAWAVVQGTTASKAAGKIHSDMEKGFIRAQVTAYADLLEHGSFQALHRLGQVRTEGRDYVIQAADVVEFFFSS
jgi:ribosome-binding ATPase YchF (GTP1/OBG family)